MAHLTTTDISELSVKSQQITVNSQQFKTYEMVGKTQT